MVNLYKYWVELLFVTLMVVGVMMALISPSAMVKYLIIFFTGMLSGRLWWRGRKSPKYPTILVIIGFLIGFIFIGNIVSTIGGSGYGSGTLMVILFILGNVASYQLQKRGYVKG